MKAINDKAINDGVRMYRATDYRAVCDVYLNTGYASAPLTVALFCDLRLFAMLYLDCYADAYGDTFFVVERAGRVGGGKQVEGYINGALDTAAFRAYYRAHWLPRIMRRCALLPPDRCQRERGIVEAALREYQPDAHVDPQMRHIAITHPAHLHINVHSGARRSGMGTRLLQRYEEHCRAHHIRGVHLITSNYHTHACAFYEHHGYTVAHQMAGSLWPEQTDGVSIVYTKRL